MKTIQHHRDIGATHILIDIKHVLYHGLHIHGTIDQEMVLIRQQYFLYTCVDTIMKEKQKHSKLLYGLNLLKTICFKISDRVSRAHRAGQVRDDTFNDIL